MHTIGERLEEARKKLGLTINDAAGVLKIRAEYLVSLEKTGGAEIPLQDIYVRGFLKNYAKYLKIDSSILMADFDASRRAQAPAGIAAETNRANKELIGRLELATDTTPAPTLSTETGSTPTLDAASPRATEAKPLTTALPTVSLPAWILPAAAGVVMVLILAGVISGVAALVGNASKGSATLKATAPLSFNLTAASDVTVIARDATSETTLFAGTIKKGESHLVENKGPVRLQYSDGAAIEIDRDGKKTKLGAGGAGKRVVE